MPIWATYLYKSNLFDDFSSFNLILFNEAILMTKINWTERNMVIWGIVLHSLKSQNDVVEAQSLVMC
jgi:hypothetical protein